MIEKGVSRLVSVDLGGAERLLAAMTAPFVPPHPPRNSGPVPVWRGFTGQRARTAVYGWSEQRSRRLTSGARCWATMC